MNRTHLSGKRTSVVGAGALELITTIGFASMLATTIDVEVTETKTSFIAVWITDTCLYSGLSDYSSNKSRDLDFGLIDFDFYKRFQ